jgi:hypothetical protein
VFFKNNSQNDPHACGQVQSQKLFFSGEYVPMARGDFCDHAAHSVIMTDVPFYP